MMVSNMHRLLLREGRNNRSNSDFQTFLRSLFWCHFQMMSNFPEIVHRNVYNCGSRDHEGEKREGVGGGYCLPG